MCGLRGTRGGHLALVRAPQLRHRRRQHDVARQLVRFHERNHGEVNWPVDIVADGVHKVLRDRRVAQRIRMRARRPPRLVQPAPTPRLGHRQLLRGRVPPALRPPALKEALPRRPHCRCRITSI